MLVALDSIAATQSQGTNKTYNGTLWLLNYAATHLDATIRYSARDMILYVHSDTSYLSAPKACSHASGKYFIRSCSTDPSKPPPSPPTPQCPAFQCVQNHAQCDGLCGRSQNRSHLSQRPRVCDHSHRYFRNESPHIAIHEIGRAS